MKTNNENENKRILSLVQKNSDSIGWLSPEERLKTPTNQGLGHSKNPARFLSDNLYHRHESEAYLTRALKCSMDRHGFIFSTLPVWIINSSGKRREPDFHILSRGGIPGIIELNGTSHDGELADYRDSQNQPFRDRGIFVKSYSVPNELSLDWANEVINDFMICLRAQARQNLGWEDME